MARNRRISTNPAHLSQHIDTVLEAARLDPADGAVRERDLLYKVIAAVAPVKVATLLENLYSDIDGDPS